MVSSALSDLLTKARMTLVSGSEPGLTIAAPECAHCGSNKIVDGRCHYCATPVVGLVTKRLPIPAEGTLVLK